MRSRTTSLAVASMAVALLLSAAGCGGSSAAPFKIGVLADCTGLVGATHDWSVAAAELPLLQHGGHLVGKGPAGGVEGAKVAGRRIEIVEGCSETGVYGRLITETRQLVEIDHVDAVVGGFGFSDGIVFRELARRYPTVPFLLVVSVAREATTHRPAANLYRFVPDIEQDTAGLATYAYRTLGWRQAAVMAEYTANGWGGVAAFTREFCALGGTTRTIWTTELGYGPAKPLLKQVPASADGLVVLSAYGSFGTPVPLIRGWLAQHPDAARSLLLGLWMFPPLDTAPFAALWPDLRGVVARLDGVPDPSSASDVAYRKAFAQAFPGLPPSVASNLDARPYSTAVDALLQSLQKTHGQVGDGRARLRAALDSARSDTLWGRVHLDRNRQAVVPVTLERIMGTTTGGAPSLRPVTRLGEVDQTVGGLFSPGDSPSPAHAECKRATPPPWAK
jgi:ABC-type branched-subunit amino acid transport system substrate-binding protein